MLNENKLSILLATGIYPPRIGGPATFVKIFRDELLNLGCDVAVLTFKERSADGQDRICYIDNKRNIVSRYFSVFYKILRLSRKYNLIYSFDITSVGLPSALAKIFKPRLKLVIRLGGDIMWERAIEKGTYGNTLENYYQEKKFSLPEKIFSFFTGLVLRQADLIIFNSEILEDIYQKYRQVKKEKSAIIKNISEELNYLPTLDRKIDFLDILYIGRLVAFKNIPRLIEAFVDLEKDYPRKIKLAIIGEGPEKEKIGKMIKDRRMENKIFLSPGLKRAEAVKRIGACDLMALTSLTEVNANTVSEALSLNKPILLTKYSEAGFIGYQPDNIYYIDPLDAEDIRDKMKSILDRIAGGSFDNFKAQTGQKMSWPKAEAIKKHLEIFSKLLNDKNYKKN